MMVQMSSRPGRLPWLASSFLDPRSKAAAHEMMGRPSLRTDYKDSQQGQGGLVRVQGGWAWSGYRVGGPGQGTR